MSLSSPSLGLSSDPSAPGWRGHSGNVTPCLRSLYWFKNPGFLSGLWGLVTGPRASLTSLSHTLPRAYDAAATPASFSAWTGASWFPPEGLCIRCFYLKTLSPKLCRVPPPSTGYHPKCHVLKETFSGLNTEDRPLWSPHRDSTCCLQSPHRDLKLFTHLSACRLSFSAESYRARIPCAVLAAEFPQLRTVPGT